MLLANYASDSDSDGGSDTEGTPLPPPPPPPTKPVAKPAAKPVATAPAPAAPVKRARKGPLKIGLDLPKLSEESEERKENGQEEMDEDRSFKKPRTAGAGGSSLIGMLPPPKRKLPTAAGSKTSSLAVNKSMAAKPKLPATIPSAKPADGDDSDDESDKPSLMMPATLKRAAAKKAPAADLDLFGLANAAPNATKAKLETAATAKPPTISAAPAVADFVPPEPTATDPYPGYYQLPSGSWAAYDPAYYASFFPGAGGVNEAAAAAERAKAERTGTGRAWAELDDGRARVVDFNVATGLEAGRKERERRAAAEAFKPKYGGDNVEFKEIGQSKGLAAERHQLTSLLSSAFSQREELEARIAQNKKNMQGAGTRYGF